MIEPRSHGQNWLTEGRGLGLSKIWVFRSFYFSSSPAADSSIVEQGHDMISPRSHGNDLPLDLGRDV
jgi:hypothetical protein